MFESKKFWNNKNNLIFKIMEIPSLKDEELFFMDFMQLLSCKNDKQKI